MTSPVEKIIVECPNCRRVYEDWWRPSINLDLDDFDDAYIEEATSASCPRCQYRVLLDNLVVRDGVFHLIAPSKDQSL